MLDHKKWSKFQLLPIKLTSQDGTIFNEDSRNIIFCQGGPNFGGGTARKFRENGQKRGNVLLCRLGSGQFYWGLLVPTFWYQNLCIT